MFIFLSFAVGIATPTVRLSDSVKAGLEQDFARVAKDLFADEESDQCQWSKLSCEGVWRKAWFRQVQTYSTKMKYDLTPTLSLLYSRTVKVYYLLENVLDESEKEKRRVKSFPRKLAKELVSSDFGQKEKDPPVLTSYSLRPTPSLEMGIFRQTKSLPTCLNRKRRVEVCKYNVH